jgi:hypothetical protein
MIQQESMVKVADNSGAKTAQVIRVLGYTEGFVGNNKPKLVPELFAHVAAQISRECDQQVAECAIHFVEQPLYRIGGAEEAIRQIGDRTRQALTSYESLESTLKTEAADLFKQVFPLVSNLDRNKSRSKRKDPAVERIVYILRDYPKKLYQSLLAKHLVAIYRNILGSITEYLHEANHCRVRLTEVERFLNERRGAEVELDPALGPGRHLLGDARCDLNDAAERVAQEISDAEREELDSLVQSRLRRQDGAQAERSVGPDGTVARH